MTAPLALVFYKKLIPGQQLVNRLQDLGYRVIIVSDPALLKERVENEKPMLLITEFTSEKSTVHEAVAKLKEDSTTRHIPILVYTEDASIALQEIARSAGANLIASEAGLLDQLPQLLEQILQMD